MLNNAFYLETPTLNFFFSVLVNSLLLPLDMNTKQKCSFKYGHQLLNIKANVSEFGNVVNLTTMVKAHEILNPKTQVDKKV